MGCVIGGQKLRHRVASASSWTKREGWVDDDGAVGGDRSSMKNEKRDDQGRIFDFILDISLSNHQT
uniref:Uncharacterized protein n=1 Tax=Romanomermis culicivorax TaxID=13658 RepID=A0A915L8U1_ROMCU